MSDAVKSRSSRDLIVVTIIGVVFGIAGGIVWSIVAPRETVEADETGGVFALALSDAPIGADMWFMLIGVVIGAVFAILAMTRFFKSVIGTWLGVIVGSIVGTFIMFYFGSWLSNRSNLDPSELAPGQATQLPLELTATGVLFVWPVTTLFIVGLYGWFQSKRENPSQANSVVSSAASESTASEATSSQSSPDSIPKDGDTSN